MRQSDSISFSYSDRLRQVLNESWKIFKAQFIHGRHNICKKSSFQHHFAEIIGSVGNLYSLTGRDLFRVDIEDAKDSTKNSDIFCGFIDNACCAIELRFSVEKDVVENSRDNIVDIESLELIQEQFDLSKMYMVTDRCPFVNESGRGVSTVFATRDGYITTAVQPLRLDDRGREYVTGAITNSCCFVWEKIKNWYFLEVSFAVEARSPIRIVESDNVSDDYVESPQNIDSRENAHRYDNVRQKHPNAYMPWTEEADERLEIMYCEGSTVKELSQIFGRNPGAISSRIKKLELREKYDM